MPRRLFVDTNVFLYARGGEHRYREPCRGLLAAAGAGQVQLLASVELVQEYTHVLLRRGLARVDVLAETGDVRALCAIRSVDEAVLSAALGLLGRYPVLGMRDAVHAATAREAGLSAIVSTDRVFDDLAEFRRLDPIALVDDIARE